MKKVMLGGKQVTFRTKISNSKQELARIISENGGWRDMAESAAQCKSDNAVSFYRDIPDRDGDCWWGEHLDGLDISKDKLIANWHQSCLSRAEYFHLYPAPDADGWIEWKGGECPVGAFDVIEVRFRDYFNEVNHAGESRVYDWVHHGSRTDIIAYRLHKPEQAKPAAVGDDETNLAAREELESIDYQPSIEQLAGDYRNKLAIATQAQEEADSHRCGAEVALSKLEIAINELGFKIEPITAKQEPELVITDWRDLRVGDVVFVDSMTCGENEFSLAMVGRECAVVSDGEMYPVCLTNEFTPHGESYWLGGCCDEISWRFIRRP